MSLGKIYIFSGTPRATVQQTIAKYLDLDVTFVDKNDAQEFTSLFPLGKVPALYSSTGFKLTETVAIFEYLIAKSSKPEFSGTTPEEKASSLKWELFVNSDLVNSFVKYKHGSTEEEKAAGSKSLVSQLEYINNQLLETKYLTGEKIYACDIFVHEYLKGVSKIGLDLSSLSKIPPYIANVEEFIGNK